MSRLHPLGSLLASALLGLACSERPVEPFCETLVALGLGQIEVGSFEHNEMIGHAASLEALLAVAPDAVRDDLELVRDRFAGARDAGGWRTLLDFADLQKPDLAEAEGRVTRFVPQTVFCSKQVFESRGFEGCRQAREESRP